MAVTTGGAGLAVRGVHAVVDILRGAERRRKNRLRVLLIASTSG
jgi:hypothetical protein